MSVLTLFMSYFLLAQLRARTQQATSVPPRSAGVVTLRLCRMQPQKVQVEVGSGQRGATMQGLHATPLVRHLYATPPPQPRGQLLQGLLLLLLLLLQAQLMHTGSDVSVCVRALRCRCVEPC